MTEVVNSRELTAREIDIVGGGHTPPPSEPLSEQLAKLPGRTVGVATAAAAIPGNVVSSAGTPSGGLLGLGG